MNVLLLGAAGFIGTNLAIRFSAIGQDKITLVDRNEELFQSIRTLNLKNTKIVEKSFEDGTDFDRILQGQDVVYHLASTTVPSTSNQQIPQELEANAVVTAKLLEACVRCGVKKVVFLSSGGTVYGMESCCPLKESMAAYPISSYGIQKVTIETLLYLYQYMYGLDYRVIRLANPYGPYQRPNGVLGAVTTFTYKALRNEPITVYGDGSVVRDFIYINDAIHAMFNIANGESKHRTFNLGCGYGTSIRQVLKTIQEVLGKELNVIYKPGRKVDVPTNYLDISRYENTYGELHPVSLHDGILKTVEFMRKQYKI